MYKYLGLSILLHLSVYGLLLFPPKPTTDQPKSIIVDIIPSPESDIGDKSGPGENINVEEEKEGAINEQEEGKTNPLQSKEFLYADYFERIKARVYPIWTNCIKDRLEIIPNKKLRSTFLRIILDKQGNLLYAIIVKQSGREDLDQCSVSSFKEAGAFPNPPKDLIDPDGHIRLNFLMTIGAQ